MRPAVINLDTVWTGQRWQVKVIDGRPGRRHDFFLTVAFRPAGVLRVERPRLKLDEGEVGAFVVTLRRPLAGSGELILSSGGVIVRRAVSTSHRPGRAAVPISRLQFAGVRLTPLGERVRTSSVTVPGVPGANATAGRVGLLTSRRGDTAEVIRRGDRFTVTGVTRTGEYQGTVDLLPGRPGGEAEGLLRVRDLPVWPLLVLILGLLLVQVLDRYQHRERPRQVLDLRLARLRDRALDAQRDLNETYRIAARPGEPVLLLDRLAAAARRRFDEQLTDAERSVWDVEGSEYRKLAGIVESFEALAETVRALSTEHAETAIDEAAALDASPVGRVLRGRPLHSTADLADAAAAAASARGYLGEFRRLYRQAADVHAGNLLARLRTGPESLAALGEEIQQRYYEEHDRDSVTEELPHVAVGGAARMVEPDQYGMPPPAQEQWPVAPAQRRRWPVPVAAAAVLLLAASLAAAFLTGGQDRAADPGAAPTPQPSQPVAGPTPRPSSPSATTLPELPAAPELQPPPALNLGPAQPTTSHLMLYGTALPLLLAGLAIGAAVLARRRWRPRPPRLDSALLDRRVRRADRRFAVVGGMLVVLSGMSVLYVANPTFGSPGDYLAVTLWGTAFGEGLTLARRIWPHAPS